MIATIIGVLSVAVCGYSGPPGHFAATTAANMFANLATDWMKSVCRFGDEAYLRRYREIDENHVIVRKTREAQLQALRDVLRRFNAARRGHHDPAKENFAGLLAAFITNEEKLAHSFRFAGPAEATQAEQKLRLEVAGKLPEAAGAALAARHGPAQAASDREQIRRACEDAVLGELRALVFEDIPPLFLLAFPGNPNRADGWFDLFFRAVAVALRKDAEFDRLWQAEQNAAILYLGRETAERAKEIAQEVRDRAIEQGEALGALAGEVGAIRDYCAAINKRTMGDRAMPLDFSAKVDTGGYLRFMPRNPLVPFFGRGGELAALLRFLRAPTDYAWWLLCGAGGAGKTRLALRLAMLAHAEDWRAGFLPRDYEADIADLDAWQPGQPTLIVVDYTLKRRDAVRVLAERLARRANHLPQPVRLLLIEREGGTGFDTQFLGPDTQGVIKPHRYKHPEIGGELTVPPIGDDDLWTLASEGRWNAEPRTLPLPRAEFFRRLDELDELRRPLVAMILADAVTAAPDRPVFDSLTQELQDLLSRDRLLVWPDVLGCAKTEIGVADCDPAIAFATMIDGLDTAAFERLESACDRRLDFNIRACTAALGAGFDPDAPYLPALEPDLIGEFFALELLKSSDGFRGVRYKRLGEAAWHIRPDRMADFVRRSAQNFPRHLAVGPLQKPVPGIVESWRLRGYSLLGGAATLDAGIVAVADALRTAASTDPAAAAALGEIAVAVTSQPDDASSPALSPSLLLDVAALADRHGTAVLREWWASAANNYIAHRAAAEAETCQALLAEMRTLAEAHATEPVLREQWAKAANNYVNRRGSVEAEACRALLAEMHTLAEAHDTEPVLREQWARAAFNYILHRAAEEAAACRALLAEMRALAEAHATEPALREAWAKAATSYVAGRAAEEAEACRALLAEMRRLAEAHDTEPALREWWAKAAFNYILHRAAEEAAACWALLAEMRALAEAHDTEPVLREAWATAAFNYVTHRAAEEAAACRSLLGEMRTLAEAHATEPALRGWWVWGCGAYVYDRGAAAPDECLAYVDATAALVEVHRAEDQLFRWHAMGAVAWWAANRQARPADAERVWERAMGLAQGREEIWAEVLRLYGEL